MGVRTALFVALLACHARALLAPARARSPRAAPARAAAAAREPLFEQLERYDLSLIHI